MTYESTHCALGRARHAEEEVVEASFFSIYLIPCVENKRARHYSSNWSNMVKAKMERASDVEL